jgi:N-acetylglucosaminyl-diphospho-decaprenol L-rhamnosyltransferase
VLPNASLSIVIVNFNTRDHLRACLRTVETQSADAIVVVDNGSSDGSVDMVGRDFPDVIVHVDRANPGYGAAANRGMSRCPDADVLLLNSDTRLAPGAVRALRAYLDGHPTAGIVGPRLVYPDGRLQQSCFPFPSPLRPPCARDPFAGVVRHIPLVRERYLATWSHSRARVVPYVMGAAMAIRRAAFDAVGGFDPSFFMYAEETDLCYRLRKSGWETHFAPVTDVVHVGGASTRQRRAVMLEQLNISSMRFYRRHYSGIRLTQARLCICCGMALRLLRDSTRYVMAADVAQRRELAENVSVWRRALLGHSAPGSAA